MAEKNKKRGGRRAHLNDFHVNLAGDYVYTGAHYSYVDQGRSRDRVQRELLGLSVAVVLAVVAGGCSDAPAMLNCWYVILPYICEAAAAVSVPTGCQLSNRVGIWASVTPQRSSISELHRLCATSSSRVPEASE